MKQGANEQLIRFVAYYIQNHVRNGNVEHMRAKCTVNSVKISKNMQINFGRCSKYIFTFSSDLFDRNRKDRN